MDLSYIQVSGHMYVRPPVTHREQTENRKKRKKPKAIQNPNHKPNYMHESSELSIMFEWWQLGKQCGQVIRTARHGTDTLHRYKIQDTRYEIQAHIKCDISGNQQI